MRKINFPKTSKFLMMSVGFSLMGYSTAQASTELAKINGTTITLEEFNKRYKDNLKFFQLKAPTKKNVLEDLIKRELGIQEAKTMGLDKDPEIRDRMDTLLFHALLEKKLTAEFEKIHISDEQAKRFYERNPEIRTSHIFVALRPDASASDQKAALEKITKIYQDQHIADGKAIFSEVAQQFSEGPSAPMGGDMDYQTRDRLDPAYYEAALKLKSPGKVSGIVRTLFGYHIIKLTAIRPWDDTDKLQVKRMAFEEEKGKIFEKYMGELRSAAKVSVRSDLIKD
ncbi:MAG: peptidylprolyl isomerase [Bdellovibrionia bacterium]